MTVTRVVTIGVYGFNSDSFFAALDHAGVDLFCDLRARRGLRGRQYAFANATRLQAELDTRNIQYGHFPELAPSVETRLLQRKADAAERISKRSRPGLAPAFVEAYRRQLASPEAQRALERINESAAVPALFCVEQLPEACHRSLAAAELQRRSGAPIDNLLP
jgi:uncharacterized protein (DUF488 family)